MIYGFLKNPCKGRENEPLEVELLVELLETVARCDRILSNPGDSSLVLIGRSGVGRHTCLKLLSVLHGARLLTPNPGKNYGKRQFVNDLKAVRLLYIFIYLCCLYNSIKDSVILILCFYSIPLQKYMTPFKQAMQLAGIDGDTVYFVMENHHFSEPSFYALIDSLLASGEVSSYIKYQRPNTIIV